VPRSGYFVEGMTLRQAQGDKGTPLAPLVRGGTYLYFLIASHASGLTTGGIHATIFLRSGWWQGILSHKRWGIA